MNVKFSRRIAQLKATLWLLLKETPYLYLEIMEELREADSLEELKTEHKNWVLKAEELKDKDYSLVEKEKNKCNHPVSMRLINKEIGWLCLQCGYIKRVE